MGQPTGRQGKIKNWIETCAATLIVASIRDCLTTCLQIPAAVYCMWLIAYAEWWSTQAAYTPKWQQRPTWNQHECTLVVGSSPAVDMAATNIMHDMTTMMAVSVQLHESRIKESYDEHVHQPRQDSALSFTSDIRGKSWLSIYVWHQAHITLR